MFIVFELGEDVLWTRRRDRKEVRVPPFCRNRFGGAESLNMRRVIVA